MKKINTTYQLSAVILVMFLAMACLISVVNHYFFRTYALDLGLYTNALYEYSHLRFPTCASFTTHNFLLLGDHFDIYLVVFSPFAYVFGSYTLLILQILFLVLGGLGVYNYLNAIGAQRYLANAALFYFLFFFGTLGGLGFDYHSNVIASCIVPWFFYVTYMKKTLHSWVLVFIICLGRENMGIWMCFVCLGLVAVNWTDHKVRTTLLLQAIFSILYSAVILGLVMPLITEGQAMAGFKYSQFGNSPTSVVFQMAQHPLAVIKALFVNTTNLGKFDYVKLELHLFLLVAGIYVLVKSPTYLLMLVPIYLQKLLHDNPLMWGVGRHYSIEFAPILAIGIFSTIHQMKKESFKKPLTILVLIGACVTSIRLMDSTIAYVDKINLRFYQSQHYQSPIDLKKVYSKIQEIPNESVLSVQSNLFPHLALRNKIYQFPIINNSEYIILNYSGSHYPLNEKQYLKLLDSLKSTQHWNTITDDPSILILKRK